MTRRKRQLTAEEHDLWRRVASTARPLAGRVSLTHGKSSAEAFTGQSRLKSDHTGPGHPATESHLPGRNASRSAADSTKSSTLNGLDRRASRLLGRGRVRIDARLDLHGMTQDAAYRALLGFLHRTQQSNIRYVLVITGKSGVLNRMVPIWLGEPVFRAHVSGVTTAGARHGGYGALYIRLRRHG